MSSLRILYCALVQRNRTEANGATDFHYCIGGRVTNCTQTVVIENDNVYRNQKHHVPEVV